VFLIRQLLPGILVALLVSGAVTIVGRLWKANSWADAIAVGLGYAVGHVVTAGWPPFPPIEATQWLPYLGIAVTILAVIDTLLRPPGVLRAVIWFLGCVGILSLLLASKFQYGWSLFAGVLWIAGLATAMLVLTSFLDRVAQRDASISLPLILAIVAGGTGLALMLSGSMLLGQLALVLAGTFGAIVIVGTLLPNAINGRGIAPVSATLLSALWLSGYFFSELPSVSGFLLLVSPVPALMLVLFDESGNPRRGLLLRAILVVVPVALAVFLAFEASPTPD
jgi:hypothetical protein